MIVPSNSFLKAKGMSTVLLIYYCSVTVKLFPLRAEVTCICKQQSGFADDNWAERNLNLRNFKRRTCAPPNLEIVQSTPPTPTCSN